MLVYKDNFGFSNISDPEERAFFDFIRRQGVLTACERVERPVRSFHRKLSALLAYLRSNMARRTRQEKRYGSQEALLDSARPS